ncbi:adenosylcobinamide-GDP ribazoletransferase [Rhizobium sp. AAP43]|uniref:adenosylcobinamide-GDP ribazoletransferase n=1 Tax=Rhizobium sp. AAP43 TaxID=1523420 RepID=UPI0006B9EEBD|nr:adenosylcobinamide-GDP ribazoletransferase [Rhizobium sp. AAP43]KPF47040.1 cobalamin synthase [Rhizobium sp. AAP43]
MSHWRIVAEETARALAFLSRLPVPDRFFVGYDGRLTRTVAAFPLAGMLIALPASVILGLLGSTGDKGVLAALMALLLMVMATGALHEDGLADCADGLGGGRDKDTALAIMKDSRIGAYGAVALIFSFGLRTAALAALLNETSPLATAIALLSAAAFSRSALVWHWRTLPSARMSGVAAAAGEPDPYAARVAYLGGTLIPLLLASLVLAVLPVATAMLVAASGVTAFTAFVRRKLDGHTGDTLGATQQVCEILFLTSLAFLV